MVYGVYMPYIDHTDLVAMVKTLIDDVEKLKRSNAELQAKVSALQYKGQVD